jgi:iron complex outermembrane receptor protein
MSIQVLNCCVVSENFMYDLRSVSMYQVNKIRVSIKLYCLVVCIFMMTNASADYDDEEALIELYGDEETISIATGTAQPISRAPAVASVITAQDIKEIGATDIDEALETVPGLHVSRSNVNNPLYTFRGIHTGTNPQVLMLINGIPITNLFAGDRNQIWGGMPVESISRIEVIRGPGSAVYGADAFAGVINIITKTASEIDGVEFGSRLGKFDSRDVWALYGKKLGNFDIALMAEWGETDGHDEDVNSDFASGLGFGSSYWKLATQSRFAK